MAWKEAGWRERESDVEKALEEVLVGDHQAKGLAENAVNNAQGELRMIKDAVESSHGRRVDGELQVAPWMVTHAVSVVNRG